MAMILRFLIPFDMSSIHKLILMNRLTASSATVLIFALVLLIGLVLRDLLSLVAEGRISFWLFADLVLAILPYDFTQVLPIGFLTGMLLTIGRLSIASERVALKASGVRMPRFSASIMALGVVASMVAFVASTDFGLKARGDGRQDHAQVDKVNRLGFLLERTGKIEYENTDTVLILVRYAMFQNWYCLREMDPNVNPFGPYSLHRLMDHLRLQLVVKRVWKSQRSATWDRGCITRRSISSLNVGKPLVARGAISRMQSL